MPARCTTTGLLAIAFSAVASAGVMAQAGSVVGSVYDSIGGAPLADAAIFLWDTPYRAVSDGNGRYRIEGVPPGDYTLLFFHTRLAEVGVSPGPRSLSVSAGDRVEIDLATPSMATIVTSQCPIEDRRRGSGAVAGQIMDGDSRVTLGGSHVTLSWNVPDSPVPETIDLRAGTDGWYRSCDVPADVPVLLSADFIGRQGRRREITVAENGFTEAGVYLFALRPTRISGRLEDATSGEPVEGAQAWLRGTNLRTLSDEAGSFILEEVPPGTYMLMVDHVAYGTKMDTLEVPSGQRLLVEMKLDTRPIAIAPITVTTEARPVRSRRAWGGIVITRQQIDKVRMRSRDATDVIRSLHIPGVLVKHNTDGTICVGYSTGQVRMDFGRCIEMVVFINDVRATNQGLARGLPIEAIERMVVYKPIEAGNLFGLGAGNGVWMIYTRGN